MPREASKRNNWEKERRERFNKAFDELEKVLPSYDPAKTVSRVDILIKAAATISELNEEINKISKSSGDKQSFKDDRIKKLQERVKTLLHRNEQLIRFFKDAGIKLPRSFGTKPIKRPLLWSNRIPPCQKQKENEHEKDKIEKENISTPSLPPKTKKTKVAASNDRSKLPKVNNRSVKPPRTKKFKARIPQCSNPLLLFSRLPTIPAVNQQFVLVQNPPVVKNIKSTGNTTSATSKKQNPKKPVFPHLIPPINPPLSNLGPGTLILANGNIISVATQPQPQIIIPPISLNPIQTTVNASINMNKIGMRKNQQIRVKSCITNTTQINKIPIPAFTSKYANTSILHKSENKGNKNNTVQKSDVCKKVGTKRKAVEEKDEKACKISKTCNDCEKKEDSTLNSDDQEKTDKSENVENKKAESPEVVSIATSVETVSTATDKIGYTCDKNAISTSPNIYLTDTSVTDKASQIDEDVDKSDKSVNNLKVTDTVQKETISNVVLNKEESVDKAKSSINISTTSCVLSVSNTTLTVTRSPSPVTVSSTTVSVTTVNSTISDENIKNIDLNLVHSDLSNDIFASLQVPPGCQNIESTSPTAAFLLAFPLVSSIKVTEVIDEENSDSQRETPTLLQIGSIDNTSKPSHNENLLSLDNFSFFNSKDIYYSTKLVSNSNEENATEKNNGTSSAISNEEPKTKENDFGFTKNNKEISADLHSGTNFEVFSKPEPQSLLDRNARVSQTEKVFQNAENSGNTSQVTERFMLFEQKCKDGNSSIFEQSDSCNIININNFQTTENDLPVVLEHKNNLAGKASSSGHYTGLIQENILSDNVNVNYNISDENLCKESIESVNYKECKTSNLSLTNDMPPQEHSSSQDFNKDVRDFNTKSKVASNLNISGSSSVNSKMPEKTDQTIEKTTDEPKISDQFHYSTKHLDQNKLNDFSTTLKTVEILSNQNLEKPSSRVKMERYHYPTLQNQHLNLNNYNQLKGVDKLETNNKITDNNFTYNAKEFLQSDQDHMNNFPPKLTENSGQNLDKSCTNKGRETYNYNPKQFLQNEHTNAFSTNAIKLQDRAEQNMEKSDKSKTYQYNQKHFLQTEHNVSTFASTKMPENITQNLEKPADAIKSYHYANNPFDIVQASKEMQLSVSDNCTNISKDRQKPTDIKGVEDTCVKTIDEKSCYFSSNYPTTPYRSNSNAMRSDSSKVCHTGSYENTNKNYANPFYTNCNYNYSEPSFNQNYYKTDKSCYSLNYENYQEYRKSDATFNRDRRGGASKEKQVVQNKPVNWMTTSEQKTSDCFLPSFTNQSYSFSSCINTDANETNTLNDTKKTTDFSDKRFTWSPSKIPNFLEPSHNFITPTLPTLVGDLALGNALPIIENKNEYKCSKDVKRKTYDNQANFLSVSQLVNQNKTDPTPARTVSRRLSGSKSAKVSATKIKRCEKPVDKSTKPVNNYNDIFFDQKNRTSTKNISSNYSAEALIGNQCPQEEKKYPQNISTYFPGVDDTYVNQNQNFHTYGHNSFQNNAYSTNGFVYTTPISTNYLNNTFDSTLDYSAEGIMNYNKNCGNKNNRAVNKEEKNINYAPNSKKPKKPNQSNATSLGNFEYPLLPIQGSTNSPLLPDDFQSHTTFLPPTTPYPCKNSLYQKQGNEFNAAPLLPIPGIARTSIQHPEVSPSLNHVGTSLTNFNLSTIFPEINKGTIPTVNNIPNKSKNTSSYFQVNFNGEPKYSFTN